MTDFSDDDNEAGKDGMKYWFIIPMHLLSLSKINAKPWRILPSMARIGNRN
jgi:hypothetical protein